MIGSSRAIDTIQILATIDTTSLDFTDETTRVYHHREELQEFFPLKVTR
ncbi:MAG: hypothetical protein KME42_25920 [Tildeniella nuda ZEHNDER 1965/U140]|nr:hypothetical protein [Tildeniella nuda ZEHNDER 1965/U140]